MDGWQFLRDLHDWLFGRLGWPTFEEQESLTGCLKMSEEVSDMRANDRRELWWERDELRQSLNIEFEMRHNAQRERDQHKRDLEAACEVIASLQAEVETIKAERDAVQNQLDEIINFA